MLRLESVVLLSLVVVSSASSDAYGLDELMNAATSVRKVLQAEAGCLENQFYDEINQQCADCDTNCLPGQCVDGSGCEECFPGFYRRQKNTNAQYTCEDCALAIPNCFVCVDGATETSIPRCMECEFGFQPNEQGEACVPSDNKLPAVKKTVVKAEKSATVEVIPAKPAKRKVAKDNAPINEQSAPSEIPDPAPPPVPTETPVKSACQQGEFLNPENNACSACDENCKTGECVDGSGCGHCEEGYVRSQKDGQSAGSCRKCDIPACMQCRDEIFDSWPMQCKVCEPGFKRERDGLKCNKIPGVQVEESSIAQVTEFFASAGFDLDTGLPPPSEPEEGQNKTSTGQEEEETLRKFEKTHNCTTTDVGFACVRSTSRSFSSQGNEMDFMEKVFGLIKTLPLGGKFNGAPLSIFGQSTPTEATATGLCRATAKANESVESSKTAEVSSGGVTVSGQEQGALTPEGSESIAEQSVSTPTCAQGQFLKTRDNTCMQCDSACEEGNCVDEEGCTKCVQGFYTSRRDTEWPKHCLTCEIENCKTCRNDIFDSWPNECTECVEGFRVGTDKSQCVPIDEAPVVSSSVSDEGKVATEDTKEKERKGKPATGECQQQNKRKEDNNDKQEKGASPREVAPSPNPSDGVRVGSQSVEPASGVPAACAPGQFQKKFDGGCMDCDVNCLPGECADGVGCNECVAGFYRTRPDEEWPYTCEDCAAAVPNCLVCVDGVFDAWPVRCNECAPGFEPSTSKDECEPVP